MLENVKDRGRSVGFVTTSWMVCLVAALNVSSVIATKYRVVQITEYARNGARTARSNSSLIDLKPTKDFGVNTLTPNGYRMQYLLGLYLRKRYPEVFGLGAQTLALKDVDIYASSNQVSQQSTYSQLLGIFPLGSGPNITLPEDSPSTKLPYDNMTSRMEGQTALPLGLTTMPQTPPCCQTHHKTCPRAYGLVEGYKPGVYKAYRNLLVNVSKRLLELGFKPEEYANEPEWNFAAVSKFTDQVVAYQSYTGGILAPLTQSDMDTLLLLSSLKASLDFKDSMNLRLHADGVACKTD